MYVYPFMNVNSSTSNHTTVAASASSSLSTTTSSTTSSSHVNTHSTPTNVMTSSSEYHTTATSPSPISLSPMTSTSILSTNEHHHATNILLSNSQYNPTHDASSMSPAWNTSSPSNTSSIPMFRVPTDFHPLDLVLHASKPKSRRRPSHSTMHNSKNMCIHAHFVTSCMQVSPLTIVSSLI